ncbi:antirestriction protein ArdR [Photorhabdus luminescens]|uniref:antirestriction protein ArdR n=1 Tax=Photorhabdus luminescens TaxID=29488 RepID=UPI00223F789C|nr:antirestriction protein ArdR [Photorhabdus luminescens]MCW7763380.1 antirestriction protein ArdR [Photorhabdus luminescens subsp. venezuelensis]
MFNYKIEDAARYGRQVYHHFRKKGNHRWDTCVFLDSCGRYSAVFRHSYSKKVDDVKKTFIEDEFVVSASDAASFYKADFPVLEDTHTLKQSDFFRMLTHTDAGDDLA